MNLMSSLENAEAVIRGKHFVYSRGQHGPDYVRIDALLSKKNESLLYLVCGELVLPFRDSGIEAVTACADDRCSRLAVFSAEHLGVKALSGERLRAKKTLIAEDVLTTGEGVIQIRHEAEDYGAIIEGASVIVNRGSVTKEHLGVKRLEALATVPLLAYEPDDCKLCAEEVPIVEDIGRGSIFRLENPEYAGGFQRLLAVQIDSL